VCFVNRSQGVLSVLRIDVDTGCSTDYWQWSYILWHCKRNVVSALIVVVVVVVVIVIIISIIVMA